MKIGSQTVRSTAQLLSPKFSFKGWRLGELLRRNKNNIKAVVSIVSGIVASSFSTNVPVQMLFGLSGGYATKFMLDIIDFYCTDVEL